MNNNILADAVRRNIEAALLLEGRIQTPVEDEIFDDPGEQAMYEQAVVESKRFLEYLKIEGFVDLIDDMFVLRAAEDLNAEVETAYNN